MMLKHLNRPPGWREWKVKYDRHALAEGIVLPPSEEPSHDEAIKILREALDEEILAQAWKAG